MKTQPILLGSLLASALLMALLLLVTPQSRPAQADMTASAPGDYQLITSAPNVGGEELLHVIDTRNEKLITYHLTQATAGGQLQAIASQDLSVLSKK